MSHSYIHLFQNFNDFHRMANGALETRHDDVQVFRFSETGKGAVKATPLFKTNFFQIGLFDRVAFEVTHFGTRHVVDRKNAVVIFKPGQTCSFSKVDLDAVGYAIMFKEHFIDWRMNNANTLKDFSIFNPAFECVLFLEDDLFNDLSSIAERMHFEYSNQLDHTSLNILKLYVQLILEKINRVCTPSAINKENLQPFKTAEEFKALVYQNIHKTKTVGQYAEMLCVTEKTLINHVKKITEVTPKEFINALIIEESKTMLLNRATVEEVAAYFNFTDHAHFSKFFRSKTGKSPLNFKNS